MKPAAFGMAPREFVQDFDSFYGLAGRSPAMLRLFRHMQLLAPHLAVAMFEGQDGTGKSLAARALHAQGPVAERAFIRCPAAQFFSGSSQDGNQIASLIPWSEAILRQANGGTLFLDRIHQLSPAQQERLAAFLHWFDDRHERALQPFATSDGLGQPLDEPNLPARIVFSSSMRLRNAGDGFSFRADLASRLGSVCFRLPPLCQRREDIPLLTQIFIERFARAYGKTVRGLGPGTIAPLLRYSWPGNVRELEEVITAAALETESQWIRLIDLPPLSPAGLNSAAPRGDSNARPDSEFNLDEAIRAHVSRVLYRTGGNKLRAAQLLGISRSTLYRILASPGTHASPLEAQ